MAVTVAPPLEGGPSEWQFFPISHALSALQEDGPLTFCILIVASLTGAMVSHGGFLTGGLVCCRSSPDQVPPSSRCLSSRPLLAGSRGGGGKACRPPASGWAWLSSSTHSPAAKLPNTYFGRSAWPEARALHYSSDISLNMLQSFHSWLGLVSTTALASSPLLKDCLAPDWFLGRNRSTLGCHCLEPLLCGHLASTGGGCLALLFRCKFP